MHGGVVARTECSYRPSVTAWLVKSCGLFDPVSTSSQHSSSSRSCIGLRLSFCSETAQLNLLLRFFWILLLCSACSRPSACCPGPTATAADGSPWVQHQRVQQWSAQGTNFVSDYCQRLDNCVCGGQGIKQEQTWGQGGCQQQRSVLYSCVCWVDAPKQGRRPLVDIMRKLVCERCAAQVNSRC
jgi:hypothetical protein